jgi:hypothetical protein
MWLVFEHVMERSVGWAVDAGQAGSGYSGLGQQGDSATAAVGAVMVGIQYGR